MRYLVLALALTAAGAPAQDENGQRSQLFAGWTAELMRRDFAAARAAYEKCAASPSESREHRAVALARLVELDRSQGREQAARRHAAALRELVAVPWRQLPAPPRLPRREFERALAMPSGTERERTLSQLRARVLGVGWQDGRRSGQRRLVPAVIQHLQEAESAAMRALRDELKVARERGDRRRALELRAEMRRLSPPSRRGDQRRQWNRRMRVMITRKLLQGQEREAERFQRVLLGDRSQSAPSTPDTDPGAVLTAAQQGLAVLLTQRGIVREERKVLEDLAEKLDAMRRDGQLLEAVGLIGRLPYRLVQ